MGRRLLQHPPPATPRELRDAVLRELAIRLVAECFPPHADDGDARRQEAVDVKVVERGQQLAMREIAGAAEDHQRHRIRGDRKGFADLQLFEERIGSARRRLRDRRLRHRFSSRHVRRTDSAARPATAPRMDCRLAIGSA